MPKWGMAVDLDKCTGCSACVVACHAENNIPTVGPQQAGRGRAMHWIRVERYWEGEFPEARLKFRPVMCQHCDAAPCEAVCPTYASHHTDEGLNAQVYNRCIGTRYCGNACAYNVRFFNFFHPEWEKPLNLQLNPDVSLREVGIMEKCTFCVQRIKAAKTARKPRIVRLPMAPSSPPAHRRVRPRRSCSVISAIRKAALRDSRSRLAGPGCSKTSAASPTSTISSVRRGMNRMRTDPAAGSRHPAARSARLADDLVRPLFHTSVWYYGLLIVLGTIVACGLGAWATQIWFGIGLTGKRWPTFWGFYLTNFVFWIGISHAGTLISAILRLVNATWRRPVTRCAEVITVFALMIGAMFPIIHLGRPWLFFWLVPYPSDREIWPNFRSPLVWDFFAINTYLIGSVMFLFLPMIPDLALVRDRSTGWRRRLYSVLVLGWRGTTKQWHRLEAAMQIMAIAILPVAVSVHTIVSFDFSMVPVPMWHSTIFGPYFVAGAIFSGIAALIIAMAVLRRFLRLEAYLHPLHFQNLGKLLLLMSLLWVYFIFAERLTVWYGNEPSEMAVYWATQRGRYAPLFWTMVTCNFLIPFPILALRKLRTITGTSSHRCRFWWECGSNDS